LTSTGLFLSEFDCATFSRPPAGISFDLFTGDQKLDGVLSAARMPANFTPVEQAGDV
jgi:hypothetical protein